MVRTFFDLFVQSNGVADVMSSVVTGSLHWSCDLTENTWPKTFCHITKIVGNPDIFRREDRFCTYNGKRERQRGSRCRNKSFRTQRNQFRLSAHQQCHGISGSIWNQRKVKWRRCRLLPLPHSAAQLHNEKQFAFLCFETQLLELTV